MNIHRLKNAVLQRSSTVPARPFAWFAICYVPTSCTQIYPILDYSERSKNLMLAQWKRHYNTINVLTNVNWMQTNLWISGAEHICTHYTTAECSVPQRSYHLVCSRYSHSHLPSDAWCILKGSLFATKLFSTHIYTIAPIKPQGVLNSRIVAIKTDACSRLRHNDIKTNENMK